MAPSDRTSKPIVRQDREAAFVPEDPPAARLYARGTAEIHQAAGIMVRFAATLQSGKGAAINADSRTGIDRVARAFRAEAARRRRVALRELQAAQALFRTEIANTADRPAALKQVARQFDREVRNAGAIITLHHEIALASIKRMRSRALFNRDAALAPFLLPQDAGRVIWRHNQEHMIGDAAIPVTKVRFNLTRFGVPIVAVQFRVPRTVRPPPPRILLPSAPTAADRKVTTAFDTADPEAGAAVVPATGQNPAVNFFGYFKVIDVTGVAPGCTIRFQTVVASRRFLFIVGDAWQDVTPGGVGTIRADPPGGGPNFNLGGGTWMFSDFPNMSFADRLPNGTCYVASEQFRTWIVEFCPGAAPNILGYWEWSYSQILRKRRRRFVSVPNPPLPMNPQPPPAGWPRSPRSGPTRWVAVADAPPERVADHRRLYPESYR